MFTLQVYVQEGCWSCAESWRIAAEIGPQFPQVTVQIVNLAAGRLPTHVFAVPAYVLDDQLIYLGNPYVDDLHERLKAALAQL